MVYPLELLDVLKLREHLASTLSETNSWQAPHAAIEHDPLWIMLAAEPELPVESEPIWFTRLREAPQTVRWQSSDHSGFWRFRLRSKDTVLFEAHASLPQVVIPDAVRCRWPGEAIVLWEVNQGNSEGARCVAGLVQVLSPECRAAAETRLAALSAEDQVTGFKAASCCLELGLLDEALQRARALLDQPTDSVLAALSHRLAAQTYFTMVQTLQDRPGLQNESHWAAALSQWHLRAAYTLETQTPLKPMAGR